MNKEGIQKFIAAAQVGDTVTICTTEGKQSYRYHGKILSINNQAVVIADELAGGTITTPIAYKHFHYHSLEGKTN